VAGKTFQFRLITPAGKLLDAPAGYVSLPAHDGLMGVLPGRAAMVVKLGIGELKVDVAADKPGEGGSRAFLIEEGFAQMSGNRLTILTTRAAAAETITESDAKAELAAAEAAAKADPAKAARAKEAARKKLTLARSRSGKGI
jgi:F-type H+-transporting ATPase subunit epsilon